LDKLVTQATSIQHNTIKMQTQHTMPVMTHPKLAHDSPETSAE
jgi:hypothetical protein